MLARLCLLLAILTCGCHHRAPATQPATTTMTPPRPLRIVSYNIHWNTAGVARNADAVRPLAPDVLLLQEVLEKDVPAFAAALQLPHTHYVPRPLPNEGHWGAAILSKRPLDNPRPIGQGDHWTFGAVAELVVDEHRLTLVSVHLSPTQNTSPRHILATDAQRAREIDAILSHWRAANSPLLILGGDFNLPPLSPNYATLTRHLTDALAALGQTAPTCTFGPLQSRVDFLFLSPPLHPTAAGLGETDASDHRPIWIDVVPEPTPPPPPPTSPPATRRSPST